VVNELCCDGLGACIGTCPEGAITIEEREVAPYDERKVIERIIPQGEEVIKAHLVHLKEHGQRGYLAIAEEVLHAKGIEIAGGVQESPCTGTHRACPGSRMMDFSSAPQQELRESSSSLSQWPIQLHLVSPGAPYFKDADVLLSADCVAYALGSFHSIFLKGRKLAIACPKLDTRQDAYKDKITALIDTGHISTLTVMTMEVPCCMGLLSLAKDAVRASSRQIGLNHITVGIKGDVLRQDKIGL
jgi:ferredoxin